MDLLCRRIQKIQLRRVASPFLYFMCWQPRTCTQGKMTCPVVSSQIGSQCRCMPGLRPLLNSQGNALIHLTLYSPSAWSCRRSSSRLSGRPISLRRTQTVGKTVHTLDAVAQTRECMPSARSDFSHVVHEVCLRSSYKPTRLSFGTLPCARPG